MKRTALLITALAAGSLSAVVPAAHAAVPAKVLFASGPYVYRADADLTHRELVLTETGLGVSDLRVSADGGHIAYVVRASSGHQQVITRTAAGSARTVIADSTSDVLTDVTYSDPSLSPDGQRMTYRAANAAKDCYRQGSAVTDGPTDAACGYTAVSLGATFNNGFVVDSGHVLRYGAIGGGNRGYARITGIDADIASYAVSPDGTRIVWDTFPSYPALPSVIGAGDFDGFTVTHARTLVNGPTGTGGTTTPVSFSHDGTLVYFLSAQNTRGSSTDDDVSVVPFAGGGPTALTDTDSIDETLPVGVAPGDDVPPGAVTAYGALLDVDPTLRWSLPSDSDLAVTRVTRTAPGKPTVTHDVVAPAASWVDTSTTLGTTYTYSFAAIDTSGNSGPAATIQMTATSAHLGVPVPTTSVSTSSRFPVTFPASDHAKVWYVDRGGFFGATSPTSLTPWDVPTSGSHVFGREGGTSTQQGHSYGFVLQVFDSHGNASLPHTFRTAVPIDGFSVNGGADDIVWKTGPTFYGGSLVILRPGALARIRALGTMQVIGTTCPTCGVMAVHTGSAVLRYDTYSATRHDRVVLGTLHAPTDTTRTWVITVEPAGTHRDVALDGEALYR